MAFSLHPRTLLVGIALLAAATFGAERAPADTPAATPLARGEYLTHGAGQCIDCHGSDLKGAPMHVPPDSGLADKAPSLAGLPMFATDAEAITFLSTTKLPDGKQARGPMPRYEFHTDDAAAIVAYLRSLK